MRCLLPITQVGLDKIAVLSRCGDPRTDSLVAIIDGTNDSHAVLQAIDGWYVDIKVVHTGVQIT